MKVMVLHHLFSVTNSRKQNANNKPNQWSPYEMQDFTPTFLLKIKTSFTMYYDLGTSLPLPLSGR